MTTPNPFGVDLYELWVAGKVLLPQVGSVNAQDNQDIHNTRFQEEEAFDRLGTSSRVFSHWRQLRDDVEALFSDTAIAFDLAGLALCQIANSYARTDADAAAYMLEQIDEYERDPDLPQPPGPLQLMSPDSEVKTEIGPDGQEVPVR